ncbi:HPF/RaiA family ribosome-associated protein [Aquimarina sp. SS2-1]|uniref:HPF/RaiA family ribosome-associated protein n=1 Tax=Aquimarina besae TaxID=3342247 RepID=UPI00366D8378
MQTVFEYKSVKANRYLETFAIKKLMNLAKKYSFIIRADIFFNKEQKNNKKGNVCGIRLSLPGPRIYASSDEYSFENAINSTIKDLRDQLERRKVKLYHNLS